MCVLTVGGFPSANRKSDQTSWPTAKRFDSGMPQVHVSAHGFNLRHGTAILIMYCITVCNSQASSIIMPLMTSSTVWIMSMFLCTV